MRAMRCGNEGSHAKEREQKEEMLRLFEMGTTGTKKEISENGRIFRTHSLYELLWPRYELISCDLFHEFLWVLL